MRTRLFWLCVCVGSYLFTLAQPPANDNCMNAVNITTLNGNCVTGNDNTLSTEDIGPSSCTIGANENVWFSFTAIGVSAEIVITSAIGTPEITLVSFPGAPCNAAQAQEVACIAGSPLIVDNLLTIGTTYYVMVAFSNNADGVFDICIDNPLPASNDMCSNATLISNLNNNCATYNNDFPSTDVLIPGCFTGSTYNVWFRFVAQGVSLDIYIPAGGPGVGQLAVIDFATTCATAGSTILGCATGTNHIVLDNVLTIGQTYYVVVGFQNSNFNGNGIGDFDLCINNPLPAVNDDCNMAIVIPNSVLNDPTTCFTTIAGNPLNNNWPSTDIGLFGCWNTGASYNIWYSFVAQGPDVEIEVDPGFSGNEPQIALVEFTGSPCSFAGAVMLDCANTTVLDYNNDLIIGQTYYVAVGFTSNGVGNFCMNVFNPVPPSNDLPCDAFTLPTNGNCQSGTTIYANPEGFAVPFFCQPLVENLVWYELSLGNPDNVGFEIDFDFSNAPPMAQVSLILWEISDCSQPGAIQFFHCGPPPSGVLEWGPVDPGVTYLLSVGTTEPHQSNFNICVDEVPPCFTNDLCTEAIVINGVQSDMAFVCVDGCNLFADPETTVGNGCQIQTFPTVWFQVNTDGAATLMNIQVTSLDFNAPTISLFQSLSGCTSLLPVGLTSANLACVVGSNGEAEAFGSSVGGNQTYYIAVSSLNSVGGDFNICVNTISQASVCVISRDIVITSRSFGGPLEGPFLPGETVGVCMNVNSYTAAGNGCQWFQGLIPVFGNGWDPSSFDVNGQPLNATINGTPMGVANNGLYSTATWDWFNDVDYHYNNAFFQIGDFDGNGTVDMCNILYDPQCPNLGGITGGCCGPCWGTPLGDILPPGWFSYGIDGTMCTLLGPPVRWDWGDGNTCGGGMGPWQFCFDLNVREYPNCLQDASTMNLALGFFTTADGETGSWIGSASVCALDQPASVTLPMCCSVIAEAYQMLDPICSQQQFVYAIDEPNVDFWQWVYAGGPVTGGTSGQGGPGSLIINTLTNNSGNSQIVRYTFLGFAGGACPVFEKEVEIEVFPNIQVTLDPLVMCATPTTPYIITPDVSGGSGMYTYLWSPGSATSPSITVPNPVNGTQYRVTVSDDVGCVGTATMTISVYSTFPVDINAPILAQCIQEGPINLDASATGGMSPYTFEWNYPGGTSSNQSISSLFNGQHLVEVTDSEGCVGKDSVILAFYGTPQVYVDAVNGALAICEGQSTELAGVASMGASPYVYAWDTPEGPEFGKNIHAFTPGTYVVTVEDNNGCTSSAEIDILAQPEPFPDLGPDLLVCNTDDPVDLSVTPTFSNYQWSIGSAGDGLQTISVYNAGTYTVTVTNEFGCTGTADVEIQLFPQPDFPMPDLFEICPGNSITIDADDYNGPWENFIWSGCPLCINQNTLNMPGLYQVIVYDFNGCTAVQQFEIAETASIDPGLQGDDVMCTGETITLTTNTGFTSYQWSANAGGATTNSVDVTAPGIYAVTVVDADACTGTASIEVLSGDFTAMITGPTEICANVLATIDAGPGYVSYAWSTTQTTQTIQVDDGTYTVTVTSTDGCTAEASFTIIETPFVPQITGDDMICQTSETTTLDAGGPYASYVWSANAGSATTQTITTSMPGLYTVTIVDNVGCVGNASFTVSNHPVPFVAVTGLPDFCVGGSTTLNATAGFVSYAWSNLDPTPSITINTAGTYTVTITDANGCTNTASANVNPPYQETVDITGTVTFCPGDQATLAVPFGYTSVLWSTGETTDQINVTTEGEISVIVVDADGCIAYDTVVTVANSTLSPNITGNPAICDGGTTVLNAGPGFDNYMWSNGLGTTQTVSVNAPGTYSVTVSSNAGCVGEDDFTVTEYTSPFATVTATASACDVQEPGGPSTVVNFNSLVTGGDTGGNWVQSSGPSPVSLANLSSVNFNGLNSGTYTFTYTTSSATPPCMEQSYLLTVTVTTCACPLVDLFAAPDLCNDLGSITLSTLVLSPIPPVGAWTVIASPPGANPAVIAGGNFNATNADPGQYTLQYTVTGIPTYCVDNATVTVNVLRNPVAGIAAAPLQYCAGESDVVGLFSLLQGADLGGIWQESSQIPSTGGAFNATAGTFNVVSQQPGTYTFDYVIPGPGPCPDDMTTVTVIIEANPVADAGTTNTLDCLNPSTTIGGPGTSQGPDFSYTWTTMGGGTVMDPNLPITTATTAGTYILTVVNNQTGCSATDQVVIDQVGAFPTGMTLVVNSPDCEGDPPGSVQVTAVAGGTQPFSYSLNGAPPVSSPVFNNLVAGDYIIEVIDASGCTVEDNFSIQELVVVDLTIINYVNDVFVFALGDTIKLSFQYIGTNNTPDSIVWKSGNDVLCINCPVLEIEAVLSGTITLEAYDERGCVVTRKISYLVVRKRDVYIPNIFSPNGDDLNDYFTLFTDADVREITLMEVYTRWGDLVFRKSNFQPNIPSEGWDGKFAGDDLNPGVYVYRIEIVYGDDLIDNLAGDITILR